MAKRIHIFRAGKHKASGGQDVSFSEADLVACAAAYDPALHEAPVVVGHPSSNAPAYGWVRSLTAGGSDLEAEAHQLHADFEEMVKAGSFKKVSASFYLPDAPNNPKPGNLYLRHVGFLGAQPPAVKGLRPIEFAEAEEGVVEFADMSRMGTWMARLMRGLRDHFIEKEGLEKTDEFLPSWMVEEVESAARDDNNPLFQEPNNPEPMKPTPETADKTADFAEQQRKLQEERAAIEADKAEIKKQKDEQRRQQHANFVESLVKGADGKGRVLPVHKNTLVEALVQLDTAPAATVEFGEGDAKTTKPLTTAIREFLQALPAQVDFGEVAPGGQAEVVDVTDAKALSDAAVEFQEAEAKKGRTISISQAVMAVKKRQG